MRCPSNGVDFVRAVRRHVLLKARDLTVSVVYLSELTIAVMCGGRCGRMTQLLRGPVRDAGDEDAVVAAERTVGAISRASQLRLVAHAIVATRRVIDMARSITFDSAVSSKRRTRRRSCSPAHPQDRLGLLNYQFRDKNSSGSDWRTHRGAG